MASSPWHPVRVNDVWPLVHAERAALIDDLTDLTDDQWDHPSLCGDWTVHDVAAHLINNAKTTRLGIVRNMARARFDFDRQTAPRRRTRTRRHPRQTLARLQQVATRTSTPPAPLDSRLVEEVVHGEDIRRPLGIIRVYPLGGRSSRSLRYQARARYPWAVRSNSLPRVQLRATDADVSIGDGPEVCGPALSLLMAISGRKSALGDLDGPGVAALE